MDIPDGLSSQLEDYMSNNKEVPENVIQDLQKSLSKPRQELVDLEAKLTELDEQWTELNKKRSQVRECIEKYECVLSPIRRIPTDILHTIFYHCLPTRRDPIMSAKEAPLLLTRVCRVWRQTAYESPPLWARLYVTFSDEEAMSDPEISYGLTKQYLSNALRLRCSAVEEWLSRSGACPLSISIYYTSRIWISTPDCFPGNTENTLTLFRILAQYSNRWQKLRLEMPIEVYRILEAMVPVSQLSALDSLTASLVRQVDSEDSSGVEPDIAFFDAPNISKLSLTHPELWKSYSSMSSGSCSNLTRLTSLHLTWRINPSHALSLLKICPRLEYLVLTLVTEFVDPQGSITPPQNTISLPFLRAISIVDCTSFAPASDFYDRIEAPQLEWIDYNQQGDVQPDPVHGVLPINTLLKRSLGLKKLTIKANNSTTQLLRSILESVPNITHLVLGPEEKSRDSDGRYIPAYHFAGPNNVVWDVGELFLRDISIKNSSGGDDQCYRASTLLPNLEILELSQAVASRLQDKTLSDIILSRLDPNTPTKRALLKKVAVSFMRPMELDIDKEIMAHSQQLEHRIQLDLHYSYINPYEDRHFVSPGYGTDIYQKDLAEELVSSQIG